LGINLEGYENPCEGIAAPRDQNDIVICITNTT